ncbi:diterpenoid dioxygenase domain protein [Mycobacterium avium subsp. avium 2285 (R)]|nr:diterpenoid dioxygenase domain protein [Mycobacterium avium subsp. avium 2285 (R)]
MAHFEKDAILSGIGISRIGRRTGIPGLELTMEAVRAAVADAGLAPTDIDGIATLGDTPAADVNAQLGIDAADCGSGFGTGGLLSPVMSACRAVAERRARHVVVYRTIQMLGGTVPVKQEPNAAAPRWPGCSRPPRASPSPPSARWTTSTIWSPRTPTPLPTGWR